MSKPINMSGRMSFRRSNDHESVAAVIAPDRGGIFKVHVLISGVNHAADTRLLAAAYNSFDSAGRRLGVNAVEFAERMQDGDLAELTQCLMDVPSRFQSCIADGNAKIEGDEAAMARAVLGSTWAWIQKSTARYFWTASPKTPYWRRRKKRSFI